MIRRAFLTFLIPFCFLKLIYAQDFDFKPATMQELKMRSYDKDTSAQAVVLNEFGSSRITFSKSFQLNKTIYPANDYQNLKDLFNKMISAEKSEVFFKKK